MHCCMIGIAQDDIGSALVSLAEQQNEMSVDAYLKQATVEMRIWCKEKGLTCTRRTLCLKLLGRGDPNSSRKSPVLSGKVRAAQTKIVHSFVTHLVLKRCTGTKESKLRATCLWAASNFYHILDTSDRFLTEAQAKRAYSAGSLYLLCYQKLAHLSVSRGDTLWKIRPKHHYFLHMIKSMYASRWNPRFHSCYMDEDFIGRIARLNRLTHRLRAQCRTPQRYLKYIAVRWERTKRKSKEHVLGRSKRARLDVRNW